MRYAYRVDEYRFAICRFRTVFDPTPAPTEIGLVELTEELTRFLHKPDLAHRIRRDTALVESAWDALEAGRPHAGKAFHRLKRARDEAEEAGEDVARALATTREALFKEARGAAKATLPCWAPATFAPGARRNSKGVTELSCLVLDYDDGTDVDGASTVWSPWFHIVHTSWSHTPAQPRFRLVLPLARPCPIAFWPRLWAWAEDQCGHEIDPACKGAARMWTLPALPSPDHPHRALSHGGPLLDPLAPEIERFHMPFARPAGGLLHSARTVPSGWSVPPPVPTPPPASGPPPLPEPEPPTPEPTPEDRPLPPAPKGGLVDQLERLARLHRDGDLTDEEFARAKARVLSD